MQKLIKVPTDLGHPWEKTHEDGMGFGDVDTCTSIFQPSLTLLVEKPSPPITLAATACCNPWPL